jgi:hypothetical protein
MIICVWAPELPIASLRSGFERVGCAEHACPRGVRAIRTIDFDNGRYGTQVMTGPDRSDSADSVILPGALTFPIVCRPGPD